MNPKSLDSDQDSKLFSRGLDNYLNSYRNGSGIEGDKDEDDFRLSAHEDVDGLERSRRLAYDQAANSLEEAAADSKNPLYNQNRVNSFRKDKF